MVSSASVNDKPLTMDRYLIMMFVFLSVSHPMDTKHCLGAKDTARSNTDKPACLHDAYILLQEGEK